jgi:hypothetical protein
VIARPVSSTRAGHPPAAQRAAIAATTGGSVTCSAVPETGARPRQRRWPHALDVYCGQLGGG